MSGKERYNFSDKYVEAVISRDRKENIYRENDDDFFIGLCREEIENLCFRASLTNYERHIVRLFCSGFSDQQIAEAFTILFRITGSNNTVTRNAVKVRRLNIIRKIERLPDSHYIGLMTFIKEIYQ